MSSIVGSVLDRKRQRAHVSFSVIKSLFFATAAIISILFKSTLDVAWEHLSTSLIVVFASFCGIEILSVFGVFLAKPIALTEKESKLLNAKGHDFVKHKPKPSFAPTRDLNESSLSSCLLNRSHDASLVGPSPTKKSPSLSQNLSQNLSSSLRNRGRLTPNKSINQSINDEQELDEYLESLNSPDSNSSILFQDQPKKSWTSPLRSIEALSRFTYQISKSPPRNSLTDKNPDSSKIFKGKNTWTQLNVDNDSLNNWTINIRRYIWASVVAPLVKEINKVNKQLKSSLPDVQLGKTSLSDLKMISHPGLSTDIRRLIPYLEISSHHGYLIQRLTTLSKGGYLSSYEWDKGEDYNGKPWSNEYPTDSAILIHILACWLDTHLPPDPSAGPDARAFSEQYICKSESVDPKMKNKASQGKPVHNLPPKIPVALIEHSRNPPEYYVQVGKEIKEVPPGRNNPLQSLLLLFYLLDKNNYGTISGVSLDRHGINIMSVFK